MIERTKEFRMCFSCEKMQLHEFHGGVIDVNNKYKKYVCTQCGGLTIVGYATLQEKIRLAAEMSKKTSSRMIITHTENDMPKLFDGDVDAIL